MVKALRTKIFGGYDREDAGNSVQQTNDGGFVITGRMDGNVCFIKTDYGGNVTGINEGKRIDKTNPKSFRLFQNYPNPFNPSTVIHYQLSVNHYVPTTLKIYNIAGKEIRTLVNSEQKAGNYTVEWDGRDYLGRMVANGLHFYQLKAGQYCMTKKLVVLR